MTKEPARLIMDQPGLGPWNMAVDQALLVEAEESGQPTLRYYSWSKPTLSLGYFQGYSDRGLHKPSLACDVVRRTSGGGAILHDREITYSLCIPSANRWSKRNCELYELVHQQIIAVLARFGMNARIYDQLEGDQQSVERLGKPFLCFQRRSEGDILLGQHKIGGSAQRRLKRSLIQHGSLLLARSPFAKELKGVNDLGSFRLPTSQFCTELTDRLGGMLDFEFETSKLSTQIVRRSREFAASQFGDESWTKKR